MGALRRALALLLLLLLPACQSDRTGALTVALGGSPVARPLVFHGNCFVGYTLEATLQVHETEGVAVVVESLEFRFLDENGVDGGGETIAGEGLDERFGAGARDLSAGGTRGYELRWRFDGSGRPSDLPPRSVTLSGRVEARNASGAVLTSAYSLRSAVDVIPYQYDPAGACPPPT